MASQYYVTIRLDPHYQQFLRSHFLCEAEVFEFPPRHFFNKMLEHFVVNRRNGHTETEMGDHNFKIALPNFAHKNPAFFRYLSELKEVVLKAEIKQYYDWIIQNRIRELMSIKDIREDGSVKRLDRQECTLVLIDEYGFNNCDNDCFDRLYKLFTRFQQNERLQNFRGKKKEGKAKC